MMNKSTFSCQHFTKLFIPLVMVCILTTGCASWTAFFGISEVPAEKETKTEEEVVETLALPSSSGDAEIVVVKEDDQFVIINFRADPVPKIGALVTAYRDKKKVATLQITEPIRDSFASADIEKGKPHVGDKVK